MLVDANGEIADDVLVDAQQALDLGHRRGGGGDVHEREVRLAVLLDAEGERLQAPRLDLGDRAAEGGDLCLDLLRQRFDLLLRHVLAHQENMLVESHVRPFQFNRVPRGALRAREGSNRIIRRREHGRTGAQGPAARSVQSSARPSVQPPAGRNEGGPHTESCGLPARKNPKRGPGTPGSSGFTSMIPGLRRLIRFSVRRQSHRPGRRIPRRQGKLQHLEHVLASAMLSSSQKKILPGRREMHPLKVARDVHGRMSAGSSCHDDLSTCGRFAFAVAICFSW